MPTAWSGWRAVVTFPERVGVSDAARIGEQLLAALSSGAVMLVADMSATVWCDQAGADAVVRAYQRAAASQAELRLVICTPDIQRLMSAEGLDRLVPVYASLEAALAAGAPDGPGAGAPQRDDLAVLLSAAAAQEVQDSRELLDRVVDSLFHAGLALETAAGLPADVARERISEALRRLDDTIQEIRDHVFRYRRPGGPP